MLSAGLTFAARKLYLRTGNLRTGTFANSEDPDEMPHTAAFYQGLHCLLRLNLYSEKEIQDLF